MDKNTETNLTTLSNAVELGASIIDKVIGEEVSNTVNGVRIKKQEIKDAIAARMQTSLSKKTGVL